MTEGQVTGLIDDVLKSGTEPIKQADGRLKYIARVNKFGISDMKVVVEQSGEIVTAYQLNGEAVWAWVKSQAKIVPVG